VEAVHLQLIFQQIQKRLLGVRSNETSGDSLRRLKESSCAYLICGLSNPLANSLAGGRGFGKADPEWRQGIFNGAEDGRLAADDRRFAHSLGSELV